VNGRQYLADAGLTYPSLTTRTASCYEVQERQRAHDSGYLVLDPRAGGGSLDRPITDEAAFNDVRPSRAETGVSAVAGSLLIAAPSRCCRCRVFCSPACYRWSGYLSYVTGCPGQTWRSRRSRDPPEILRSRTLLGAVLFVAGFSAVFVAVALSAVWVALSCITKAAARAWLVTIVWVFVRGFLAGFRFRAD